MPRPTDPIDDTTPLSAARIDVPARIGWLLRTYRTTRGLSLRQMSAALAERGVVISAPTLSRVESEGQRSPAVLDGYAAVCGLPEGLLRTAVDLLCRGFSYGPASPVEVPEPSLEAFSRAVEAVQGPSPTAGDWLAFARHHADDSHFGLPRGEMEPLARRLTGEVGRGVAAARFVRHNALTHLLDSAYRQVVGRIVRDAVDDLGHQNFYDLTSALTDKPTRETLEWAGQLLSSPSLPHVRGASYVLQGMLVIGGLPLSDWEALVPHLQRACSDAHGDPVRTVILAQLAGVLPPDVQRLAREGCGVEPVPPSPGVTWSRSGSNPHYAFATHVARTVCARRGHPEEPLLARLLFEAFFEPRGVRMSVAAWYLAHTAFATDVVQVVLDDLEAAPDPASRAAALRVAALCHDGRELPAVLDLVEHADGAELTHATTILGRSGGRLPDAALSRGLAGDEPTVRHTLYCLGMAGDPRLPGLAADPALPAPTRRAAAWWLEQGSRILV